MNFDTSTNDYGASARGPDWVLEYTLSMRMVGRAVYGGLPVRAPRTAAAAPASVHDGDMSPVYSRPIVCTACAGRDFRGIVSVDPDR
jgi:hypothetical protein